MGLCEESVRQPGIADAIVGLEFETDINPHSECSVLSPNVF